MLKSILIILIGSIISLISLAGLSNPKKIFEMALSLNPTVRYLLAIISRVLLGGILIYSADVSSYYLYVYVIGGLLVLSAIIIAYLRPNKITVLLNWFNEMPNMLNRVWMLIGLILGVLLILAGIF